jgi:outer membrane immunogenic protein
VDFQTGGFSASATGTSTFIIFPVTTTGETKLDNLGSVQARLGYAMGRWLPYVTGGYAFGEGEHTTAVSSFLGTSRFSDSKWYNGWTVGLGAEYAINRRWSVKGEYRYTDLGSETLDVGFPTKIKLTNQALDLGVNYRF